MAADHIDAILKEMQARKASDVYLTYGSPPAIRIGDDIILLDSSPLEDGDIARFIGQVATPDQLDEYQSTLEINTALNWSEDSRFRVNIFRQQGHDGMVIRRIEMQVPKIEELKLPGVYGDVSLAKRGLILVAGPTGSGKSTSLAAMVGHRNAHGSGHIITVEDPIEFIHRHDRCIITQRDVGLDTYSYSMALKNALRQRPDMVVIGEIRDREVMEQAIYFAETSHLCIATIHANNSSQVIERVLNFFPEERHRQILLNLALNLKAVLTQRLVTTIDNKKTLAVEVMMNLGLIRQLIVDGKIRQIREMIEKGTGDGMQTFDQSLLELYKNKEITEEVAMAEADSAPNLGLLISQVKRTGGAKPAIEELRVPQQEQVRIKSSSDF